MLKNLSAGCGYALGGFKLIWQPGLRKYLVLPVAVNFVVFALVIYFGISQFQSLVDQFLPEFIDWAWLRGLLWLMFGIGALLVVFYGFTLVANFIASPFNALLAEQLEHRMTGSKPPSAGRSMGALRAVWQAMSSELTKLVYLISWAALLGVVSLLLFFTPGLGLLIPGLWALFGAWMLALEYADYPLGNHGIGFREVRAKLKQNRSLALGFGATVLALTACPGLNLIAMPVAVAGATAMCSERLLNKPKTKDAATIQTNSPKAA